MDYSVLGNFGCGGAAGTREASTSASNDKFTRPSPGSIDKPTRNTEDNVWAILAGTDAGTARLAETSGDQLEFA